MTVNRCRLTVHLPLLTTNCCQLTKKTCNQKKAVLPVTTLGGCGGLGWGVFHKGWLVPRKRCTVLGLACLIQVICVHRQGICKT